MKILLACLAILLLVNEYLVYYLVMLKCECPSGDGLRAMVLADTHLLGSRRGHWWDKLRREWQMYRSFQTAVQIFQPEVIFFLGDIFDEGKWCDEAEFEYYVNRFHSLFSVPDGIEVKVVVGNHDIGFHYAVTPRLRRRFEVAFNTTSVELLSLKGNKFIFVNSVAMEGDGCTMCHAAERKVTQIGGMLTCAKTGNCSRSVRDQLIKSGIREYSAPILMQHYPLFRNSDEICDGPDAAVGDEKRAEFREKWDCLSRESSDFLLTNLQPRLIFSGHTHHGCNISHKDVVEHSVASFSWRNRNNPNFLLALFTPGDVQVEKCFLPYESTVINIYMYGCILAVGLEVCAWVSKRRYISQKKAI